MKTIRNEILILTALAAAEWFDMIHYFFALLISLTILCAIAITCIVFLFNLKSADNFQRSNFAAI